MRCGGCTLAVVLLALAGCVAPPADPAPGPMLATPQPVWATGPSTAGQEASGPDPEAPPTLYVSPEGDDGAAGTSPEAALATLEAALARAGSGDGIYLLPGVYAQSSYLEEVFDPENPLWIAGEPGASILDGGGELPYALWCEACAGIVLRDLVIRNYTDACVALIASEAIAFERVEIAGCGFAPALTEAEFEGYGFYVEGSQAIAVEDSEVHHNGPNPQRPGFLVGTAVNLYACSGCLVRGNRIHNNVGAAVLAEDSHDVVIEDNQIFGNELDVTVEQWWDGAIWIDGGADVVVRGNALYGNNGPALQISDEEGAGPTGYVVEGNAITGNRIGVYLWGFGTWEMPEQPVLRFEGNTLEANELGDVFVYPEWCLPPEGCG